MFPTEPTLGATLPAGRAGFQSFVLEGVLTFVLMFVILSVSTGARRRASWPASRSVRIVLEALFAGPISGASMNPARSLAPALVSWRLENLWVYLTAPVLGRAGVVAYRCVQEEPAAVHA